MEDILAFLDGKKTYIAATGLALLGVVALLNGETMKAGEYFMAALAAAGLRAAVAKSGANQ